VSTCRTIHGLLVFSPLRAARAPPAASRRQTDAPAGGPGSCPAASDGRTSQMTVHPSHRHVLWAPARPCDTIRRLRSRRIKLLACNVASALRSFHNCSLIHAGIRPRNIYVDEQRIAMVGESRKVELDSLRCGQSAPHRTFLHSLPALRAALASCGSMLLAPIHVHSACASASAWRYHHSRSDQPMSAIGSALAQVQPPPLLQAIYRECDGAQARVLGAGAAHDAAVRQGGRLLGARGGGRPLLPSVCAKQPVVVTGTYLCRREFFWVAMRWKRPGQTLFQMMTGSLPFPTSSEDGFRDAVLQGASYLTADESSPLHPDNVQQEGGVEQRDGGLDPVLCETVLALLHANPLHRWTAEQALAYLQFDFALGVQRVWRGFLARRHMRRLVDGVTEMQALVRGVLVRQRYAPSSQRSYAATGRAMLAATEPPPQKTPGLVGPTGVREEDVRALQAETDELIGQADFRREEEEGSDHERRGHGRGRRGSSSRASMSSRGGGGGQEEELARLQSLLQARDVQLQVLMRMLSEADSSAVHNKQEIAMLQSRLGAALGSSLGGSGAATYTGTGAGAGADGGSQSAMAAALELGSLLDDGTSSVDEVARSSTAAP
jgi:hypothetical protein